MPVLKVQTNAVIEDKEAFMQEATALLSKVLGKPAQYIMIIPESGTDMMFAGNREPALFAELKSISLPEDETAAISAELCAFLENSLGVPQNRMYIEFSNAERHMFGWNGGTF
jgi:phenylpyruvate tautomerase PptA (4-oxalocrotonate tautomerase family)